MAEGTIFFPEEPVVRVTAPLPEAQFVESRIINILHFQSLIASKGARCVLIAPDKLLVDFGFRRAHGAEAGLFAARASYLAGFAGTATVLAGKLYDMPVYGTMAHSYIQAHEDETSAFLAFAHANPDNVVFLIDTYNTEEGARRVAEIAPRLVESGITVRGVRLDSGDLLHHAAKVRAILDEAGLKKTIIFSSGNLDEYGVLELLESGAPIDGFGIGTRLDTAHDAPYLDCAYKLQEYAGVPRRKRSEGKGTLPGRKQVYRVFAGNGEMAFDLVTTDGALEEGEPLLVPVMYGGERTSQPVSLEDSRACAAENLRQLPPYLRGLSPTGHYPVKIADSLRVLAQEVDRRSP
jgi:nicotinate phosphoribosyltransferase